MIGESSGYYGLCFGDRCNRCFRMDSRNSDCNNNCGWICTIFNSSICTESMAKTST